MLFECNKGMLNYIKPQVVMIPTPSEIEAPRPFLHRRVIIHVYSARPETSMTVKPKIIVTLGIINSHFHFYMQVGMEAALTKLVHGSSYIAYPRFKGRYSFL